MPAINFFFEDTPKKVPHVAITKNWIREIIHKEGYQLDQINYIFCSDPYLKTINKQFLDHDYFTDIITFNHAIESTDPIEADIYISMDRVSENASTFEVKFQNELLRVIIHGILHLLGYDDKTSTQQKEMRKKEEACLSLLKNN